MAIFTLQELNEQISAFKQALLALAWGVQKGPGDRGQGEPRDRQHALLRKKTQKMLNWIESDGSVTGPGILPTQESLAPRRLS